MEVYEGQNTMKHSQALLMGIWGKCCCGGSLLLRYNEHRTGGEVKCKACEKSHGRFTKETNDGDRNKSRHCNTSV